MRNIGTIDSVENAQRFHNYLLSLSIENQIESSGDTWSVWVHEEDDVPQAASELDQFLAEPTAPQYSVNPPKPVVKPKPAPAPRRRVASASADSMLLTKVVVIVSILISLVTDFASRQPELVGALLMTNRKGNALPELMNGQLWRLYTPLFLHFSVLHIIFNGYAMWILGGTIERMRGTNYLLWLILVITPVSHLTQFLLEPGAFGGLSGMIFGLFGFIWMRARFVPRDGFMMPGFVVIQMVIWLFLGLSGKLGAIANGAHFGGLIAGMMIGAWPAIIRKS